MNHIHEKNKSLCFSFLSLPKSMHRVGSGFLIQGRLCLFAADEESMCFLDLSTRMQSSIFTFSLLIILFQIYFPLIHIFLLFLFIEITTIFILFLVVTILLILLQTIRQSMRMHGHVSNLWLIFM